MRMANVLRNAVLLLVVALLASTSVWAGTVGKVRGKITNKKTKEAVPFAVVQIDGTTMGAQADVNGEYMIINVPPGVYSVTAKLTGYTSVRTEAVDVRVDQTSTINFALDESVIETEAQVVTAQRDLLKLTETANLRQITAETIKNMPVSTVQDVLKAQVGVVERFGEIHIRGGRNNEVMYVVDGVSVKDPLGGLGAVDQAMNISGNVIEDMQIIKGGFDAEYGNAQSGIVNITTKSGSNNTTAHLEYFTDDFGTGILNKNSYNYDRGEFNLSGPEPYLSSKLLPSLGINWFNEKLFYSIQAAADKTDDYVSYKQYFTDATSRDFKSRSILGLFDLKDRMKNSYEAQVSMRYQATPNLKLNLRYRGSWDDQTNFQWNYVYTPATAPIEHEESHLISAQLTHQLDKSTYYEVTVSRFNRDYLQMPGDPNRPGEGLEPDDFLLFDQYEYFYDRNGNGKFDQAEPFINANGDTSWLNGGPFYTFGDAFADAGQVAAGLPGWPLISYELSQEYRGVSSSYQGQRNSSATVDTILTDWNNNGMVDFFESEQFVDLNGDGKWNAGDYLIQDTNGNGKYDPERSQVTNIDNPEPYRDGDQNLGEPFTDVNLNGVYDAGIDIFILAVDPTVNQDLNRNSKYDGPSDPWLPGTPFLDRNKNGVYDPANGRYDAGESYDDLNRNGRYDARDGFYDRGHQQWAFYQNRSASRWTADFKINKQFSKEHDVKTGLSMDLHTIKMADLRYPNYSYDGIPDGGAWGDRGVFRDFYTRHPITGAVFVQDKMEYGSMIANLGLRYDFFIQSSELKQSESVDQAQDKSILGSQNRFSPRVGFSYPISDRAKVQFYYGHFNQLPDLNLMYQRATQASNAFGIIGNENLDFSKTIQYEFGVSYKLSEDYVLGVSGFYKDIFGIINSVREGSGPNQRNVYQNSDYARTRGFEFELEKTYGNYVQGIATYEYSFAYGKSSDENSNYFDDFYSRSIPIQEFPLNWDVRHQISLNIDFAIPQGDHPSLFGLKLPDNWGANVLWQFGSGFPYTPDKDYPGLRLLAGETPQTNSLRYPATSEVDIRAYKRFPFIGLNYTVTLWVNNLFDAKNIDYIYGLTGRYNSGSKTPGSNYVFEGTPGASDPTNLGPGRNIRVGFGVEF